MPWEFRISFRKLPLFPGTGTAGRQSVLPLHSIYCFSELCRYGAGCQDCPIHKRCLQLFYLCSMFHQIHSEARMKHTLMLHLVFLPVHVSVRPGQRAPQAHILTRVKEAYPAAMPAANTFRRCKPSQPSPWPEFHGSPAPVPNRLTGPQTHPLQCGTGRPRKRFPYNVSGPADVFVPLSWPKRSLTP